MHGLAVSPRRAVCGSELLCLTSQEEDTSARQARSHDRKARCSSRSRFCLRVGFPFRARTNVAMHRMRLADSSLLTISAHFVNFCLSWNIVKVSQISLLYNTREHPITKPQGASEHGTGSQTEAATGPGGRAPRRCPHVAVWKPPRACRADHAAWRTRFIYTNTACSFATRLAWYVAHHAPRRAQHGGAGTVRQSTAATGGVICLRSSVVPNQVVPYVKHRRRRRAHG